MRQLTVREIITRNVVAVRPETPLSEVFDALLERRVPGISVVDAERKLLGIITEHDLIARRTTLRSILQSVFDPAASNTAIKGAAQQAIGEFKRLRERDVMNAEPLTLRADSSLHEVLQAFEEHHRVNPIPIVDAEERLLGIVSRYDALVLLRAPGRRYAKLRRVSYAALRVGVGMTFAWIGVLILLDPVKWGELLEPWVVRLIPLSVHAIMVGAALVDMLIGVLLMVGFAVEAAAIVGTVHLLTIIAVTGFGIHSVIAARDVGLIAGLVGILLMAPRTRGFFARRAARPADPEPRPASAVQDGDSILRSYVTEMRARGSDDAAIRAELEKAGWSADAIARVLSQ